MVSTQDICTIKDNAKVMGNFKAKAMDKGQVLTKQEGHSTNQDIVTTMEAIVITAEETEETQLMAMLEPKANGEQILATTITEITMEMLATISMDNHNSKGKPMVKGMLTVQGKAGLV